MCDQPLERLRVHASLLSVAADARMPVESSQMLIPITHP